MKRSTNAELVILHLLSEQPRHGYEIEEVIEERGMREWTDIGFSSIYYLLNKLEKTGMVRKEAAAARRGPSKNVFTLTETGFNALRQGALESLSRHDGDRQTLLLGLANLSLLTREEALAALKKHQQGLAEHRQHISRRNQSQGDLPEAVQVLFDYSFTMIDAHLAWLHDLIERIESGDFSWSPIYPQEIKNHDPKED